MTDKNITLLVRDNSELSKEVEDFLIENKIKYNVLYSNEKEISNLPSIHTPLGRAPLKGKKGFAMFKHDYKELV
ncbi:hypothetical protein KAI04_01055 [Candidatus Pacearchaeota archaeon]|nr:hypothetical protein [Candidatus Pacearchaeota archaeon]